MKFCTCRRCTTTNGSGNSVVNCRTQSLIFGILIILSVAATAQERNPLTFRAESSVVLVPTLVTTQQGKVVFGLQAKDFALFDNGVEQKIQLDETFSFRPVSLVVAVQRGGRAPQVLGGGCPPPERENIFTKKVGMCQSPLHGIALMLETFVKDPGSEMALISFDSRVAVRHPFTSDIDALTKQLETLPAGDSGSAILDAIQQSLGLLKQRPDDHRRVLIVISEKTDRSSSHIARAEAVRQIAATNTEVYMIAMDDLDNGREGLRMIARLLGPMLLMSAGGPPGGAPPGAAGGNPHGMPMMMGGNGPLSGANASDETKGPKQDGPVGGGPSMSMPGTLHTQLALVHNSEQNDIPQTIANLTGGEYVLFSDRRGLDDALGLLANHAHNRYQLSYQVLSREPGMHRISVRMREPMGVSVAARTSYWQRAVAPSGSDQTDVPNSPAK